MKGFRILKYFILFIFLMLIFSKPVFADGSDVTDIDKIFDMFNFEDSSDSSLLDTSMTFSADNGTEIKQEDFWNKIFTEYTGVVVGIAGVCSLTFALLFLFNFTKLGTTAGNPQARKTVQINLLWTGLCAGASAIVAIIVSFSYGLLR